MRTLTLLLLFLFISIQNGSGQTEKKYNFEVLLLDAETGDYLKGVEVHIKDQTGYSIYENLTNSKGRVIVKNRSAGEVLIFSFHKKGYENKENYKHTVAKVFTENNCIIKLKPIEYKPINISGITKSEDGKDIISNVNISVILSDFVKFNVQSDDNGKFSIQDQRIKDQMDIELVFSKTGYESNFKRLNTSDLKTDKNIEDILLKKEVEIITKTPILKREKSFFNSLFSLEGVLGTAGIISGGLIIRNGVSDYKNLASPIYSKYKTFTNETNFLANTPEYSFSTRSEALEEANKIKNGSNRKILLGSGLGVLGIGTLLNKFGVIKLWDKNSNNKTHTVSLDFIEEINSDYAAIGVRLTFF